MAFFKFRPGRCLCFVLLFSFPFTNCGPSQEAAGISWQAKAERMVQRDLMGRDITSQAVLAAMRSVPRHLFVPRGYRSQAYDDTPLPIGRGQTISQPYVVAFMAQESKLTGKERVLEIGTGSGYGAAVLAKLAAKVYTIELIGELGHRASATLKETGFKNVEVKVGDGYQGWPEAAPFDRIVLTAAPPKIPQALIDQLKPGGILLGPVGDYYQEIVRLTKSANGTVKEERLLPVRFVPMVPGK